MRFHIVSDVHGATAQLAGARAGADALICLGDLLLYLDYDDPGQGAFAQVYGAEVAREYISLRLAQRFDEARELTLRAWQERHGDRGEDRMTMMLNIVAEQYSEIFRAMPDGTYFTFGNVDVPMIGEQFIRPSQHWVDGASVEIGGVRCGFVGGGLPSRYRTPNEIPLAEFDTKVAQVGEVDILCSHIPPLIPDLTYDVIARRFEVGSAALLELIRDTSPRFAVFGHVHNPLGRRFRIGRTECTNVGHFRSSRVPFVLNI